LGVNRSGFYYHSKPDNELNLRLMRLIDEQYTETPFYGILRMTAWLKRQGYAINHKRVEGLMRKMGLQAIQPRRNISHPHPDHRIYPYLLRDVPITHVGQVFSSDITFIRLNSDYLYLTAVIDWFSRYVLAWRLSERLESDFCVEALCEALDQRHPEVFNSDQGRQFTSRRFTGLLEAAGVSISMDGRGRALDNVFVERLWRSVKYEEVYLHDYQTPREAHQGLNRYFKFYNQDRLHQSLGYRTPGEVYSSTGVSFRGIRQSISR
jgi:putative transposase